MLTIDKIDGDHAVGHTESVLINLWRRDVTCDAISNLLPITHILGAKGKAGMLIVVEESASVPTTAVRAEIAKLLKGAAGSLVCTALVFRGEGFRAAVVRAVTTTIYQLANQPFPLRTFNHVDKAALWMARFEARVTASDLVSDFGTLRRTLDEHDEARRMMSA
ncbi:MAG: hypothetical protein ACI9KE_001606 [Polyangiales bacterium]